MQTVTANQPFYGSRAEGMWQIGDSKEVSDERAKELEKLGLIGDAGEEEGAATAKPSDPRKPGKTKPDALDSKTK